jgi:hypothetical protein
LTPAKLARGGRRPTWRRWAGAGAALAATLTLVPLATGGERRYSGQVHHVDLERGVVTVTELADRGREALHAVRVAPDTPIVSSARRRAWEMSGSGAFDAVPVSLVDLLEGDFVVIESLARDEGDLAIRITVVEAGRSR